MTKTEQRIEAAAKILGKAVAKLAKQDPEMARTVGNALAAEMQKLR
jgi:hypothetical protein